MVISLRDVSVTLDGAEILRDVTIDVGPGEWLGIVGPNGAGKSTMLKAIAGLVPFDGTVDVTGDEPGRGRRRAFARQVAYVAQDPLMPDGMTVFEYVLLGRTAHLSYLARESRRDHDIVRDVLEHLDLTGFEGRPLSSLSGGEQQRAALGRALAQQAPLLLLDEPTSALDVGHQQQVLELVEDLRHERGLAVVSAMHDLTLASQFTDRLLLLSAGRAAACGPAAEVLTERALHDHWGARVRVHREEDGTIVVVPVRARARTEEDVHERTAAR